MLRVVYSYNKKGYEGACWSREIAAASSNNAVFVPFNHSLYLDPLLYTDAIKLDRLYRERTPGLMRMYEAIKRTLEEHQADVLLVANCPPYHPDFLKKLPVYKVLYSADDPEATYMINIPYLHAYNHVFFVDPVYSPDMDMTEKMRYAGMVNADWLPISVFDFECDPRKTEAELFEQARDIDVVYVGSFWRQKVDSLARVGRALGRRCRIHGFFRTKHNVYLNFRYGWCRWVRPLSFQDRVALYQRARIGFNMHWSEYGLGNQRLYHLPANGVMQISDCVPHVDTVFRLDREIAGYRSADELIDKIRYYLAHEDERAAIAREGYRRTMREYRFATGCSRAVARIEAGMARTGWQS